MKEKGKENDVLENEKETIRLSRKIIPIDLGPPHPTAPTAIS